jgi:serine/threonine protein kinase
MENHLSAPANKPNNRPSMLAPDAILQNRYRIVRQLGKGGMGAVYEAVDQRLDAIVALKETFSVDDRLRQQFEQEARLLAQLYHPALPRVSDYFTEGERAFLVMQFISGADLAEIIATQPGPFPRNVVIAWADQLLDALIYLHTQDRQIIHRDIKPHNLKVTSTGQIALLDFGLAKAQRVDASGTNSSTSIFGYSRRYSPLEQIQDQGTTPRSDIYALGATLYHLLTGVKPQDALARAGALANSKSDPLKPANEVHRAVGPEIAAILSRAMALSPEDRYASASEFRGALGRVGRMETPIEKTEVSVSAPESADAGINNTVVRREPVAVVDPFDSYSILKPADTAWLIPKHGRHPGVIAVVAAILLTAGVGTFYGFGRLIRSADSVLDYARTTSGENESGTASVHQSKSEKSRVSASGAASVPATSAGESSRKNDSRKTRNAKPNNTHSRTPSVVAPPLAIPAIQTTGVERNR